MDIVKALEDRASVLKIELDKIQRVIGALNGTKTGTERVPRQRKWHHTPATKRKLRLAQNKIWAAKRRQK